MFTFDDPGVGVAVPSLSISLASEKPVSLLDQKVDPGTEPHPLPTMAPPCNMWASFSALVGLGFIQVLRKSCSILEK